MRDRASAMYLLNSPITSVVEERFFVGLAFCAETHCGAAAATRIAPVPCKRFRRVSVDDLCFTSTPSWCGSGSQCPICSFEDPFAQSGASGS
jgi:hypothetical protein